MQAGVWYAVNREPVSGSHTHTIYRIEHRARQLAALLSVACGAFELFLFVAKHIVHARMRAPLAGQRVPTMVSWCRLFFALPLHADQHACTVGVRSSFDGDVLLLALEDRRAGVAKRQNHAVREDFNSACVSVRHIDRIRFPVASAEPSSVRTSQSLWPPRSSKEPVLRCSGKISLGHDALQVHENVCVLRHAVDLPVFCVQWAPSVGDVSRGASNFASSVKSPLKRARFGPIENQKQCHKGLRLGKSTE